MSGKVAETIVQRIENLAENLAIEKREKIKNPERRWKKITTKKISHMKSPPKRGGDLKSEYGM